MFASFVASCGGIVDPGGQIVVCYAVDDDGVPGGDDDDGANEFAGTPLQTRRGLRTASVETSWPAPAGFTSCVATIVAPVQVELIDEDDHHVWLAVDVVASGTSLMNERVFSDIVDGELTIAGNRAWGISDLVQLDAAGELRLALQNGLPLDDSGMIDFITIEDAGASGLPTWTSCQSITARKLAFRGTIPDIGDVVLDNGGVGEVFAVGEYVVTNVGSFEYGEANCTDIPSGVTHVSWAVIADR
ncbi:MAG TPA: hypothetical protein VGF99_16925 [Myxococcota bacterium]